MSNASSGGPGVLGLLLLLFIALKLLDKITWSWTWVLAPVWMPLAAVFFVLIFAALGETLARIFTKKAR